MANSLGLPEFIVENVERDTGNKSIVYNVTMEKHVPYMCLECFVKGSMRGHGTTPRTLRDTPVQGKHVYLKVKVPRYRCEDCGHTVQEDIECADEKFHMTIRLKELIKERCLINMFSQIARDFNLVDNTIRDIFAEHVKEAEKGLVYKAPRVLGIDEVHLNKRPRGIITDIENKKILDILPSRDSNTLAKRIISLGKLEDIKIVTMDMYWPYKLLIDKILPSAKIIVDRYHVVQEATRMMDSVRTGIWRYQTKAERAKYKGIASVMKKNSEDLTSKEQAALDKAFLTYPKLGQAYRLKEKVRRFHTFRNRLQAGQYFTEWLKEVEKYNLAPFNTAADTFMGWSREIFNYYEILDQPKPGEKPRRFTNAYTESMNKLIKKLNDEGRSLSFEQLRYKMMFSTRATEYKRFKPDKATYAQDTDMSMFTDFDFDTHESELLSGFGVDIDLLADIINSPEW